MRLQYSVNLGVWLVWIREKDCYISNPPASLPSNYFESSVEKRYFYAIPRISIVFTTYSDTQPLTTTAFFRQFLLWWPPLRPVPSTFHRFGRRMRRGGSLTRSLASGVKASTRSGVVLISLSPRSQGRWRSCAWRPSPTRMRRSPKLFVSLP